MQSKAFSDELWIMTRKGGAEEGKTFRARLAIQPEPESLSVLCNWSPDMGSSVEYFREYLLNSGHLHQDLGIHWSVLMSKNGQWLTPYANPIIHDPTQIIETWYDQWEDIPVSAANGEIVNWHKLPVVHSRFPEFWKELGWSPSPFQRVINFGDAFTSHYDSSLPGGDGWKEKETPQDTEHIEHLQ